MISISYTSINFMFGFYDLLQPDSVRRHCTKVIQTLETSASSYVRRVLSQWNGKASHLDNFRRCLSHHGLLIQPNQVMCGLESSEKPLTCISPFLFSLSAENLHFYGVTNFYAWEFIILVRWVFLYACCLFCVHHSPLFKKYNHFLNCYI